MRRFLPFKLAGGLLLLLGLSGCIDAKVDVEVQSATTARATMTQVMTADFYAMIKMNEDPETEEFCAGGRLTENTDGSATCVLTEEGAFRDLTLGSNRRTVRFEPEGKGLVRVSLPMSALRAEVGGEDQMDAETEQMIDAFFRGQNLVIRFAGARLVDTNMEPSADGKAGEATIPLLDIIKGAQDLPETLYAVVAVP